MHHLPAMHHQTVPGSEQQPDLPQQPKMIEVTDDVEKQRDYKESLKLFRKAYLSKISVESILKKVEKKLKKEGVKAQGASDIVAKLKEQGVENLDTLNKMTNEDFKDVGINVATREKIRDISKEVYKAFPKKPNQVDDDELKKLCFSPRDIKDGDELWVDVSLEGSS